MAWSAEQNQRQNEGRAKVREIIVEAKRVPCADCGNEFPPVVMEFDHRGDDQKTVKVADWPRRVGYSEKAIAALRVELERCDVVCANCHRLRHADDPAVQGRRRSKLPALH